MQNIRKKVSEAKKFLTDRTNGIKALVSGIVKNI